MHVIMLAWLHGKSVPCDGAGGIEKMTAVLCAELIRQGHQVTLIAPEGSHVEGAAHLYTDDFDKAYEMVQEVGADVLHSHECWSLESVVRRPLNIPFICTTHVMHAIGWSQNVVYLSKSQRSEHGTQLGRNTSAHPVIPVPISPALVPRHLPRQDYLLYLGRIEPYKGVLEAAKVAHLLNRKLIVAGPISNEEYAIKIANMAPDVLMVGEVKDPYRSMLIEQAYAMMCLFNDAGGWCEPGCGVFGESIALGTPVAAFYNGCMAELVNRNCGFLDRNIDDIATWMEYGEYPSPYSIEQEAKKYDVEKIVGEYVSLYEQVANGVTWG